MDSRMDGDQNLEARVILDTHDACINCHHASSEKLKHSQQVQRNLSHKNLFRGEWKTSHPECSRPSKGTATPASIDEKGCESVVVVPIRAMESPRQMMMTSECCKLKRSRRSRWLDPRCVVVIFTSLSCMGSLILLYFTLAMRKINDDMALT